MKVRKFLLANEKGQQFDMNNYKESCLLTSPSNLGYSNKSEFQQIGNTFIENNRSTEQKNPSGTIYFKSYDKCKEFIDFVEKSNNLKFIYIIPFENGEKTYYRDVSIKEFQKSEKVIKMLACPIVFYGLSLWYEENSVVYTVTPQTDEIRWDFKWDSSFTDYDSRNLQYINKGHVEAPIVVEIDGNVVNPRIELYVDGELYQTVNITTTIEQYEKLLYDSRENNFSISKQNTDGTIESLFSLDYIKFENDNVIRIPKNRSCEIRLAADNEVLNAKLTIYPCYKAV